MSYVPVFKSGRPEVIRGGDTLRIHRIYPVGMTQRQALFTWKFQSDEHLQIYIGKHPCTNLEVIFVQPLTTDSFMKQICSTMPTTFYILVQIYINGASMATRNGSCTVTPTQTHDRAQCCGEQLQLLFTIIPEVKFCSETMSYIMRIQLICFLARDNFAYFWI